MSRLGCDVVLGDIQAQNISCKSITVDDASNPTIPTEITVDTITATEKLLVSNNAMILNNTNTSSTSVLLGNSGETVGDYLSTVYPESVGENTSYTVQQLSAGDNGSQSIILTGGGAYEDDVKNTIQSYDSYRKTAESLYLNPLGGDVRVGDTLSGTTANFDVINVSTLNVSNPDDPDDPTIPTDLNVNSITATSGNIENLTTDTITSSSVTVTSSVACNSLTSQNTTSDEIKANNKLEIPGTVLFLEADNNSNEELSGNSAITAGEYLTELYPNSTSTYALQQLSGGDNASQSIILTSGGLYQDDRNSIQGYDTLRNEPLDIHLNPLGGTTFITDLKPVNQTMGAACYMIKPNFACSTFICTIRALANDESGGNPDIDQDNDQDLLWCVNPGFKIIVYNDGDFNGTAKEYDNTNGLVPTYFNGFQNTTSIQVFFNSVEINPFNF